MFCCCKTGKCNKVGIARKWVEEGYTHRRGTGSAPITGREPVEKTPEKPVHIYVEYTTVVTGILFVESRFTKSAREARRAKRRWRTVSFNLPDEEQQGKADRLKSLLEDDNENENLANKTEIIRETKTTTMSNTVPAIGKPAPVFKGTAVVDGQFKEISLEDYKGKYVVFFFYPLDFTFVCPTEIIAFSDRVEEFQKIGCEVVACSTDSHFSHLAWTNTPRKEGGLGTMKIPLLADKSMEVAKAYGVLKEDEGIAFRGLFVIDGKQNLRQVTINDLPVGRDVDETLRLVQAFQFTDEHGEVCPAGWKPGAKTMKADPTGSKEYFQNEN